MSSDEWLDIVRWLEVRGVNLTVDVATRFGAAWRRHDAARVRAALEVILGARVPLTITAVNQEIRRRSSRWIPLLETRHRELFPGGCPNKRCELCLDKRS